MAFDEANSPRPACDMVSRYLTRFLDEGERSKIDVDAMGEHAAQCPTCYSRLSDFFKTVELPDSKFIEETMDELALSLFNLARAIIRERPPDEGEEETALLEITEDEAGSVEEHQAAGEEMLEDAEDYAGSTHVAGVNIIEVRGLLQDADKSEELRVDLALRLFRRMTEIQCRYRAKAWNWIAALHYRREQMDEAESACLQVLALKEKAIEVRAYAHCTLSYIFKHRGDLDRAVLSARRSAVLAEEDGQDAYFGRFAELYTRLLREGEGDESAATKIVRELKSDDAQWQRFTKDVLAQANEPVLKAYRASHLQESDPL